MLFQASKSFLFEHALSETLIHNDEKLIILSSNTMYILELDEMTL